MRKNISPDTKMIAVIKADGYGHGAVPIARMMEKKEYIWGFAVATAEEAYELRDHQIQKPILILGYTFREEYRELCQRANQAHGVSDGYGRGHVTGGCKGRGDP